MEKKLPPLDSRWDNSIPNQTNPPTPNFHRNGAMGPNGLGTIAPHIPNSPTPNFGRNGAMGRNELGTIASQIRNSPTPNFDRNGAMGPNRMETIAAQIPMGIPNQTNPVTSNFDRNGAMGSNELVAHVELQIPMEPSRLTEERKSPPLYSQREMETKTVEIQRLVKVVHSQGLQALGEKEMEKAKITSGYQNQVRFLNADLKKAQEEAQLSKSMLKKSEEKFSKVSYFQNSFRHQTILWV